MRSGSPQPRAGHPKPHLVAQKPKSGIPRCSDVIDKGQMPSVLSRAAPSAEASDCSKADVDPLKDLYAENEFLGRLVQDMRAKLAHNDTELQRLLALNSRHEDTISGLRAQADQYRKQLRVLQQERGAMGGANSSLADQYQRALAQHEELEGIVVELNLRLQHKDRTIAELQDRYGELEAEVQRLQASTVTAEHVSQQLNRVEAMYRSRVEAIKEDCREKLAAQEAAARARLGDAQVATSELLEKVKRAALREVQRVEGFLEGKVMDQLRVLDQLSKRCRALEARTADMRPLANTAAVARSRAVELERRLREAEEATAAAANASCGGSGCGCCCGCDGQGSAGRHQAVEETARIADLQQRLADLRGELVAQVETTAQLQLDLVAAQQARVVVEERLESVEATCSETRTENIALRTQLVAGAAPGAGAAAHASALRAAEADAATHGLLQSARREQVATSRALLGQLRRMQVLEAMRLKDLQEIHELERRLAAALQERSRDRH